MISRFFKKKPKTTQSKKIAKSEESRPRERPLEPQRLLTAEGWKRMMMRKSGKSKK